MATLSDLIRPHQRLQLRWVVRLVAGVALAGAAIFFLSRQVDWAVAVSYLRQADPVWFFLGVFSVFLNNVVKSWRWRLLFPPEQQLPSHRQVFHVSSHPY